MESWTPSRKFKNAGNSSLSLSQQKENERRRGRKMLWHGEASQIYVSVLIHGLKPDTVHLFCYYGFTGCLLQIETFQLVMERFLQSDFPSWQELESHEYIKEKKTRQVSVSGFEPPKVTVEP